MASAYAGFGRRFVALIIDCMLLGIVLATIGLVTRHGLDPRLRLIYALAAWLYFALLESSARQATPGKQILGIKVTDVAGNRIGFGRATGRYFAKILSGIPLGIGYVMNVFTSRRQTLHDMIAETLVVDRSLAPEDVANAEPAPRMGGPGIVAVVIVFTLFNPITLGILAAIAIPAYQNYTTRAQITEGLTLANSYKLAITQALENGRDPATIDTASLSLVVPQSARFTQNIGVQNAVVTIEYGKLANSHIQGKALLLIPGRNRVGRVVWICGRANAPANTHLVLEDMQHYTSVPLQFLPSGCR